MVILISGKLQRKITISDRIPCKHLQRKQRTALEDMHSSCVYISPVFKGPKIHLLKIGAELFGISVKQVQVIRLAPIFSPLHWPFVKCASGVSVSHNRYKAYVTYITLVEYVKKKHIC